jgi:hypothetical protein
VLLPVEVWFLDQVLREFPHPMGLIDGGVDEIYQIILTACCSLGIKIVASTTDADQHAQTAHENVFKHYENFMLTQKLDEISRHFVGKMEHWALTDFIRAAKNFPSRILKDHF